MPKFMITFRTATHWAETNIVAKSRAAALRYAQRLAAEDTLRDLGRRRAAALADEKIDVEERYIGVTADLKSRLADHNAGRSPHTSKFTPWRLVTYIAFSTRRQADAFEAYLKSGSGHAFARKRLW